MPHTVAGLISATACLLVVAYAMIAGRHPERLGALACLVGLATPFVQDRAHWLDPQRRLLMIDVAMLLIFLWISTQTRRVWVIPATAAQILCVLVHFLVLEHNRTFHQRAYLSAEAMLNYIVLASLCWGVSSVSRPPRHEGARLQT